MKQEETLKESILTDTKGAFCTTEGAVGSIGRQKTTFKPIILEGDIIGKLCENKNINVIESSTSEEYSYVIFERGNGSETYLVEKLSSGYYLENISVFEVLTEEDMLELLN